MECNFFGNIVNSVNFQDAGICPVRKIELKTSSIAIKYSSGATFNNSAVRPESSDALLGFNRLMQAIHETGNHAGAPGDLQGPRCRMRGGGRNGPTRNSSGAVAADSWCSELKRGADGVKKLPCLSNYWPKPKHDKHHRFCKHP